MKVSGEMRYLWWAVDYEGEVLESLVTKERDKAAVLKFTRKLMKRHGTAQKITTDGRAEFAATSVRAVTGEP
jgi:putative transposase